MEKKRDEENIIELLNYEKQNEEMHKTNKSSIIFQVLFGL